MRSNVTISKKPRKRCKRIRSQASYCVRPEAPGKKVQRLDGGGFFVVYPTKGLRYSPELSPGILNRVVHNTAWIEIISSGYIQKKIVKKIEDCKVYHDGTVRDANKNIMQFLYGADGFNAKELLPTKHTSQPFFINLQNIAECLNAEAELLGTGTTSIPKGGIGKLRVLKREEVDLMVSFIQVGAPGFQTEVVERATFNIKTILRACVAEIKIYEYMIPIFCRKIKDEFEEAKAKMGYMAGLVAASSIGEPTTQMSVLGDDRIPLKIVLSDREAKYYCGPIGNIIDELFEKVCSVIYHLGGGGSAANPDIAVYVNTVDPKTSKCSWQKIEEISRHPANGKLVKVTTRSGRTITTTLSHSHLKRCPESGHIVPIRGDQLEVGHFIPVCRKLNNNLGVSTDDIPLDFDSGYVQGFNFDANTTISPFTLFAPEDFVFGFLNGVYDNLGPIFRSKSIETVEMFALLCSRFGFFGDISRKGEIVSYFMREVSRSDPTDIVWDAIETIEIIKDPKTFVYDLGVTGNHTFMMQNGLFTHNTLNTFHSTGQSAKDVTLGVPRLKELLNVAKKPSKPTCSIFLNDDKLKEGLEARKATKEEEAIKKIDSECLRHTAFLSTMFAEKKVKHFMKSYDLKYVPTEKGKVPKSSPIGLISYKEYEPSWWVEMSKKLIDRKTELEANVWVIIIELDINLLYINTVTPSEIASKIEEEYGDRDNAFCCIASPICIGQIEVYINFTEIGSYTRDRLSTAERPAFSRSTDKGNLLNSRNIDYFTVRDVAINLIESVVISGISGITKTYVHQKPDTGEWTIDTQGTALTQLLAHPLVDSTRTISDNIWEVYRIFGIEATRKFLIREITKILSFDGTYINPRHITLLVDAMCRTGYPTSVNRDGIARDVGPLAKGMFEKAVENFAESAAFGEHDIMQGVSAAVMMGIAPFVGTGTVDIKDEDTLPVIRY